MTKAGQHRPDFVRAEPAGSYGLTAVTLGEVLKDQLDKVAEATNGNRSQIIREALERYFEQLPGLQKQRKEQQQKVRERAFLIVLSRILRSIRSVLDSFDFRDVLPEDEYEGALESMHRLEDWLQTRIPDDRPARLKVPELEEELSDFERGCDRLLRGLYSQPWPEIVHRWQNVYKRERAAE
jgi:predicted DNA-binding protein